MPCHGGTTMEQPPNVTSPSNSIAQDVSQNNGSSSVQGSSTNTNPNGAGDPSVVPGAGVGGSGPTGANGVVGENHNGSSDGTSGSPPNGAEPSEVSGNGQGKSDRSIAGEQRNNDSSEPVTTSNNSDIQINSALLKDHKGVKITGLCNVDFLVFLVPYIYIHVKTDVDLILLRTKSNNQTINVDFSTEEQSKNKCHDKYTFKLIVNIHDNILTLKWKVYDKVNNPPNTDNKVDIRKFMIRNIDQPITSIQIFNVLEKKDVHILESKNYPLGNVMPDRCDIMATNCFFSGISDIEKCYKCTLLTKNLSPSDECSKYASKETDTQNEQNVLTTGNDEESVQYKLMESINNILDLIYKIDVNNNKELVKMEEMDNTLKGELMKYCKLLKQEDVSGTLENHELANHVETYSNLTKLLEKHNEEKKSSLLYKLKNPAICMKYAENWITNKTGLVLPNLSYKNNENKIQLQTTKVSETSSVNQNNIKDTFNDGIDGIIDLEAVEQDNKQSFYFTDNMFCNDEYCDRWKDKNTCISKIEAQDQGSCATSWIFASKLHLETIRCMKGYEHASSSALYVANCAHKEAKDKCHVGSNPLEFLKIIDENKFLPLEVNLPYSYAKVGNTCPNPQNHWTNLWANVELLDSKDEPNSLGAKGYTAYESDKFRGNMDTFIKKIKHEVMHKGSVIAYVKVENVMGYDLNGKKVLSLCGGKHPDAKDKCHVGSNPLEFLKIIDENKFLPLE
ncbi:serine-repeat antigen, partial [Plasmodium malariae]